MATCCLGAAHATAQLPGAGVGVSAGASLITPYGRLGTTTTRGYGAYFSARVGAVGVGLRGTADLIRLNGPDSRTTFGYRLGPQLGAGPLKFGLDVGHQSGFTGWTYTPNLSFVLGPLELGTGLTFLTGGRWLSFSGGARF